MKRNIIAFAFACLLAVPALKGENVDSTRIVEINNRTYRLDDNNNKVVVKVYDSKGDTLQPVYESRFETGRKETVWRVNEVVSFPFSDMIQSKKVRTTLSKKTIQITLERARIRFLRCGQCCSRRVSQFQPVV